MKLFGWALIVLGVIWVLYGGMHLLVWALDKYGIEGGTSRLVSGLVTAGLGVIAIAFGRPMTRSRHTEASEDASET